MRSSQSWSVVISEPLPRQLRPLEAALSTRGCLIAFFPQPNVSQILGGQNCDLVLLRLPGASRSRLGFIRELRQRSNVPCVIVSDRGEAAVERIAALDLGADEYLLSYMSDAEMAVRVQAVLRRSSRVAWQGAGEPLPSAPSPRPTVRLPGGWELASQRRSLVADDDRPPVRLTGAEYELLCLLAAAGGPVDRDAISVKVFRRRWHPGDRAVDALVKRVRKKFPPDAIVTVRGHGYALMGDLGDPATEVSARQTVVPALDDGKFLTKT